MDTKTFAEANLYEISNYANKAKAALENGDKDGFKSYLGMIERLRLDCERDLDKLFSKSFKQQVIDFFKIGK